MRKRFLFFFLLPVFAIAQTKEITLEDIYKKGTFRGEFVPSSFDASKKDPEIKPDDLLDESGKSIGQPDDIIYSKSNPNIVIIRKNIEQIYRHSSKATVYMYDMAAKKLTKLDNEKLMHPTLSPDGRRIAYVKNNNLVLYEIATKSARAITTDGKWNEVINGNCDWVYEEEFSFTQAYQWSPQGNYIAYYRFDESKVKEYQFTQFDNSYNKQYTYKYPKAGEANSVVDIHIYDIASNRDVKADFEQGDIYIPRIKWTQDDNSLVVFWMNRHQNELKLLLTNAKSGDSKPLYQEKNKYYIDINDDWQFTKDGKSYLFTSEKNGFNHIYMNSLDGKIQTQISKGNYEVTEINGVDEVNKRVFYTMAYPRPMDRNFL
ncbi:MAG: DPP IV N-terminal domain-containing protein [Chitinophagaceae bacterium]|nr:DPP IV N-terminal domain-containing protein [Chitinophagaceae bacterium]